MVVDASGENSALNIQETATACLGIQTHQTAFPLNPTNSDKDPATFMCTGSSPTLAAVATWYFQKSNVDSVTSSSISKPSLLCSPSYFPSVKVDVSCRFTSWLFDLEGLPRGFHDIILGISTKDLHIDTLESITFSIAAEDGISTGPCEIVSKHELKPLLMPSDEDVIKLKLHQRLEIHGSNHTAMIVMEIRTTKSVFSDLTPGFLELHFMELYAPHQMGNVNDPSVRIHRPFLWSLSVVDGDYLGKSSYSREHKKVIDFAIAGDSSHAATLAATELGLLLDIWDVGYPTELYSSIDTTQLNMEDMYRKHPRSRPTCCARTHVTVAGLHEGIYKFFKVSVSWDASQIAIIDASASMEPNLDDYQSAFSVFRLRKEYLSIKAASSPQGRAVLTPSEDHQHCESLRNLRHFGRFHITATRSQDIENELFVVFDGSSVQIFSVFGNWKHVRTIILDQPNLTHPTLFQQPKIDLAIRWRLIKSIRGRYFAWAAHHDNVVSAWDMENGSMVTFFVRQRHPGIFEHLDLTSICFSSDGSILAIHGGGCISTYRADNGTMLASFQVSGLDGAISGIRFIRGDTQIMFDTKTADEDYGRGRLAFILDASDMTLLDRVSLPGRYVEQPSSVIGSTQNLYTSHGPNLDFIRLDDRIVKSYSQPDLACDERCFTHLSSLSHHSDEIDLTSGLCFKTELRLAPAGPLWHGRASPCIVVLASQSGNDPVEKLVIPSAHDRFGRLEGLSAVFLTNPPRFLVASKAMLMIWTLPTTLDGELKLILAWCIRSHRRNVSPDRVIIGNWATCLHNQIYIRMRSIDDSTQTLVEKVIHPRAELAFYREDHRGMVFGMMFLITTFYKEADKTCKKAFLRYVGSHINSYHQPDNPDKSLLATLCLSWTPEYQDAYEQFLAAMLGSPYGRWVPGQGLARSSGALLHLLLKTEKEPRAMGLIEIIIDYCIRQARDEKDLYFLVPIRPCLHYFANHKLQTHADLALRTLQRLAFFPVKSRSFVIDHHTIVHFPPTQWASWGVNTQPLHLCKDPVLQLSAKMQHNPINYNFTRDLFVAAFDMIWVHKDEVNTGPNLLQPVAVEPQFSQPWRYTLIHTLWYMCKLRKEAVIVCHDFSLEALDNPAIAALIEYKWNTIGFRFWLARFVVQCCYYVLVLTAMFLQVYRDNNQSLSGVFIAITVWSFIFLWLELAQFLRNRKKYFRSIYNIIDLAAFALPLAGSVNQIFIIQRNTQVNIGFLSFSALFIFLHFLFELRVNKKVCHFVTIIIQIISEIRVFFFIFAGGLLVFTTAILHLLWACPIDTCPDLRSTFPKHFYGAISSTYFFMGGRYDSIDNDFDSENWAFHTMMLVYFFFTVILMLNVLIAVINVAFSVGDGTWRLVWLGNRLRYVESAENLTFHIPGFREAYNWFPDVIYYSATPQQVKAYEDKHLKKNGEDGSVSNFGFPVLFGQDTSAREAAAAATARSVSLPKSSSSIIKADHVIKAVSPLDLDRIQTKQQDLLQQMLQNQNEEQREMIEALKQELRDQRQVLEAQMGEMQDQFIALQEQIMTHFTTTISATRA